MLKVTIGLEMPWRVYSVPLKTNVINPCSKKKKKAS